MPKRYNYLVRIGEQIYETISVLLFLTIANAAVGHVLATIDAIYLSFLNVITQSNAQSGNNLTYFFSSNFLLVDSSAVGKSTGTGCVTLPVAAHSTPRTKVVINPTPSHE